MERQMTCIIVDDEPLAQTVIAEYLQEFENITVVAQCGNAHEAFQAITDFQPDIMFLDIQMPEINGFELLEMLDEIPHIIFSTAYDQYAIRAFDVNAVDYLLKPYDQERFRQAIERVIEKIQLTIAPRQQIQELLADFQKPEQYQERILIKEAGQIIIISCREIRWIEAMDDYVRIHTGKSSHLLQQSMTFIESRLDPRQFLRAHRSYIVNIDAIQKISSPSNQRAKLILNDHTEIPLSRSGATKLNRFSL